MQTTVRAPGVAVVRAFAAAALLAVLVVVAAPRPADATITGVSPPGATVDPGQGASATVTMDSQGAPPSRLSASAPPGVSASVSPSDGQGSWSSRLSIGTSAGTPPGTYTITLTERDKTGTTTGSATFTLTVRGPAPTTTTARPTTTRPPATTTTTAPPTTEPPVTEAPTTTTTTAPAEQLTLAAIAERPLPREVLFLPFPGQGRDDCVPLEAPCVDPDFELVVVPADDREIVWSPAPDGAEPSGIAEDTSVAAVGVEASMLASADFLVPVIDARPAGGRLELVPRVGSASGPLLVEGPPTEAGPLAPNLRPAVPAGPTPLLASTVFDEPVTVLAADLSDSRPAVVVFGEDALVVMGVIADPGWRLDGSWLPLLKATGMAHLARHPDGRVGLAVPTNIAATAEPSVEILREAEGSNWLLIGILGAGAAAVVAGLVFTRRRS